MDRATINGRGSRAVATLEEAWNELRAIVKGLPSVVFVSLDASNRRKRRGHFAGSSWRHRKSRRAHEIGISPALFASAEEVLATMLHEAAHALLFRRMGIAGCGKDGYYHLKEFRDCCRDELGLKCEFRNARYGYADTGWSKSGVPEQYKPVLRTLKRGLPWGSTTQVGHRRVLPKKLPCSGHVRLICSCGRTLYTGRNMAAVGAIICGRCSRPFESPG
jgi:hypothetical protein